MVALLEVARVLDELELAPPVDLYLAWFGSHERGPYGSTSFTTAHQDLLDRTLSVLQIDCLSSPLLGVEPALTLEAWPYWLFGHDGHPWLDRLASLGRYTGSDVVAFEYPSTGSDNLSFTGFDVPNLNLAYWAPFSGVEIHHAGHLHSPYDTVAVARREASTLVDMARLALTAALQADARGALRVTPTPDRRALFVASHTEGPHMTPATFTDLGMALAWSGFDVALVPYSQPLASGDLEGADLVVALPVHDYPCPQGDEATYDEAWSVAELDALEGYVEQGGLLVMANTGKRLTFFGLAWEDNEDWSDVNALAERFGVAYQEGVIAGVTAEVEGEHPLVAGVEALEMPYRNGVPFAQTTGEVLARAGADPVVAILAHGGAGGEVLVLADLGVFCDWMSDGNRQLFLNLAAYARSR